MDEFHYTNFLNGFTCTQAQLNVIPDANLPPVQKKNISAGRPTEKLPEKYRQTQRHRKQTGKSRIIRARTFVGGFDCQDVVDDPGKSIADVGTVAGVNVMDFVLPR